MSNIPNRDIVKIESHSHPYAVEAFETLAQALQSAAAAPGTLCIVDKIVLDTYKAAFDAAPLPPAKIYAIEATEPAKSFEALTPIFVWLLENGLKRDGSLLVVGGGVLQDIGCFIASVLFRGVRWELIPTTLLAQCDSCIGSKSSINIASYKNQIGTFYAPHRVCLTYEVLGTLPYDEIRSGAGEILKLHLLAGEPEYQEVLGLLADVRPGGAWLDTLPAAVESSLKIKKAYIEQDEFDKGIRNLLNYGHTFGHAYESATHYGIPHGISVTLGVLTATYVSARLDLVTMDYFERLSDELRPFHVPYAAELKNVPLEAILRAMKLDKKSTAQGVNCILTRGAGQMEKRPVALEALGEYITEFLARCA